MTDVDIKIENIVASASIGKDIVLTEVAKALEGVDFNREQFPGLVFKLQDPKTAALIFSSGKLVCTGAKSIDDSKLAIKKTVDLMRTIDTEIPHEFDIKIQNIVASASIGKDIVLTEVSEALEGVNFNREQFPGLVFKLKDPKTAALIFSSGKLVCTGAKSIDDSKLAIKKTVDLMRTIDTEIPHEFEIKIQNIVASANLESTLNLEAVALELEDTEYEPEQFPGLVYRLSDPKVVLLLFGSGKVVCTGAKTKSDAKLGVERAYDRLSELDLI